MIKVTKNSKWFDGRITAVKKFEDSGDLYGCLCVCGKKLRLTARRLNGKRFPCDCGTKPKFPVAVTGTYLPAKVDKKVNLLTSKFQDEVSSIQAILDANDSTDSAALKFQKQSLKMLLELIPYGEVHYRQYSGERAAYALCALLSQARELVSDLKSERDYQELALRLCRNIINPAFISVVQNIVDTMYYLKRNIEPHIKENEQQRVYAMIDDGSKSIAKYIEESYADIRDKMVQTMTK